MYNSSKSSGRSIETRQRDPTGSSNQYPECVEATLQKFKANLPHERGTIDIEQQNESDCRKLVTENPEDVQDASSLQQYAFVPIHRQVAIITTAKPQADVKDADMQAVKNREYGEDDELVASTQLIAAGLANSKLPGCGPAADPVAIEVERNGPHQPLDKHPELMASISIDEGEADVNAIRKAPHGHDLDRALAATRIQGQYRRHVYRRNLLDQLGFFVRQHRRESRKKSRRLSAMQDAIVKASLKDMGDLSGISKEEAPNDPVDPPILLDEVSTHQTTHPGGSQRDGDSEHPAAHHGHSRDAREGTASVSSEPIMPIQLRSVKEECDVEVSSENDAGDTSSPPESVESDPIGSRWERYMDSSANKSFYYNPKRQLSQWNRPLSDEVVDRTVDQTLVEGTEATTDAVQERSEATSNVKTDTSQASLRDRWERYMDSNANKSFYYNPKRQLSQWIRPTGAEVVDHSHETEATSHAPHEQSEVTNANGTSSGLSLRERWERYMDSNTNKSYYFNPRSHTTQWERPADAGSVVDTVADPLITGQAADESYDRQAIHDWWLQVKREATVLESFGGWDRCLCQGSANEFYHHVDSDEFVDAMSTPPTDFTAAKAALLTDKSSTSDGDDRWTLRRNRSLRGDRRGEWQAFVDPETHQRFYYNTLSGESTWDKPAAFCEPLEATADLAVQYQWVRYVDAATAQPYYVNLLTGDTTWERPVDFEEAVGDADLTRLLGISEATTASPLEDERDAYVISVHDDEDAAVWMEIS